MSNIDDYLQQAHEGMQHFERTDDPSLVSTDLLQKILAHPNFSSLPRHLQHTTFASAGAKTLERFLRSADGDLDLTIEFLQRAIQLANTQETVGFVIAPDKLSFLDLNIKSIVEPGWFDIMVGTRSVKYETVKLEVATK